jgi:drug/metabolite transporter (DMT)-like permease
MVAARGVLAGAVLTYWAMLGGASRPTWREWRAAALIGLLILACGAGAGTYGQRTVASGVAGVLSALLPLFAACIGYLVFREKLPRLATLGLAIGFVGVGILLRPGSGYDLFGVGVIVLGQMAWAFGAELAPRVGLPEDPRLAAGLELLAGGIALFLVAMSLGDLGKVHVAAVPRAAWLGFAWFVLIAIVGFTAFGFLTNAVAPALATTFSYVNPVVAILLGWLLYGEPITIRMIVATGTIVVGVCLIVSTKPPVPGKVRHPFTSGHGHRVPKLQASEQAAT